MSSVYMTCVVTIVVLCLNPSTHRATSMVRWSNRERTGWNLIIWPEMINSKRIQSTQICHWFGLIDIFYCLVILVLYISQYMITSIFSSGERRERKEQTELQLRNQKVFCRKIFSMFLYIYTVLSFMFIHFSLLFYSLWLLNL